MINKSAFISLAIWFLGGCTSSTPKNSYVFAEKLWSEAKYAAAVLEFDKVTLRDPKGRLGMQALYRSAMTQTLFLGQHLDAIARFEKYIQMGGQPETAWAAQKQIGEIYFERLRDYPKAIAYYRGLLEQRPVDLDAAEFFFRIGSAETHLWKFSDAVATFQTLRKRYPTAVWAERALFLIGQAEQSEAERESEQNGKSSERFKLAIQAYQEFLKQYPASTRASEAKFAMASCEEQLDHLDQAWDLFKEIQKTYPVPGVVQLKIYRIEKKLEKSNRHKTAKG